MNSCPPLKIDEETANIYEALATVNEPLNYKSIKSMVFDLPYDIIRIEKGWTSYGERIKVKLSGNEEIFKISLPKRYVEIFSKHLIDLFNRHAGNLSLTRWQGTVSDRFHFALRRNVWLS